MKTDSLNSNTDGNGVYRTANPVASRSLTGPDVVGLGGSAGSMQGSMAGQAAVVVRPIRVMQQDKKGNCNCK